MGGFGGDLGESEVKQRRRGPNYFAMGALVLVVNFVGNLFYPILLNDNKKRVLLEERKELLSARENVQSRLDLLGYIDCNTRKCLEFRLDLEGAIRSHSQEIKKKDGRLEEIAKSYRENFERALVYGYFK